MNPEPSAAGPHRAAAAANAAAGAVTASGGCAGIGGSQEASGKAAYRGSADPDLRPPRAPAPAASSD